MRSIERLSNESKVIKMDTDKLKKLKNAILCARVLVILFIPMCMVAMSILAGLEIVNRDLYFLLLIIGCTILFFGFMLVDELNFLIRWGLTKRKLMSDSDETDKTD